MGQTASIETGEPEEAAKASGSQTLLRGLDVIDALIDGPLSLAELSEHLQLTRSTTHRLASALVDRRLLSFRPREGYTLGPKLLELGHAASQQMHLPRIARPWLEQLSAATEDTVHLGVLDGRHALYLDKVGGRRRINIGSRLGERHPIASTGLGKALILDKSEPEWIEFYSPEGEPFDSTARAVWLERMRGYAARGYAFDLEENEDQIRCVAAPVRGVDGQVIAAISVSSAAQYMSDARMAELTATVMDAANAISLDLGWSPKP
ncbi:MAG TPA: IclR family transcriptional regulator [Brevundimonas sp.]|nr:IclR family transcriptional regulator [Brevundimonas sp.]